MTTEPTKVLDITLERALSAFGRPGPGSLEAAVKDARYGLYSFTTENIGQISAQLPKELEEARVAWNVPDHPDGCGKIETLRADWHKFLVSGHDKSLGSLAAYSSAMSLLASRQSFTHPPLLHGSKMTILDGRHRLFAAYEFGLARERAGHPFVLHVYWSPT